MTTWQQHIERILASHGEDPAAIVASEFLPVDLEGAYEPDTNTGEKCVWTTDHVYLFIFDDLYRCVRLARNPTALMPRTQPGEVMVTVRIQERWERTVEFPIERQQTEEHRISFEARCILMAKTHPLGDSFEYVENLPTHTWTVEVE